jgi:hypothetical protein
MAKPDINKIKYLKINPFKVTPSLYFYNYFKNDKKISVLNRHESHSPEKSSLLYNIKIKSLVGNVKITISSDYLIKIVLNYAANNKKLTTRVPEEALYFLKTNLV